jgi:hypothetical protein
MKMKYEEVKSRLMASGWSEEKAAKAAAAQMEKQQTSVQRKATAIRRFEPVLRTVRWDDADILDWIKCKCAELTDREALKDFKNAFFAIVEQPHVVKSASNPHGWDYDCGVQQVQLYQAQAIFEERRDALLPPADLERYYSEVQAAERAWQSYEEDGRY